MPSKSIVVVGGGAAGVFGAIAAAESNPDAQVTLIEKSPKLLTKVKISGGGRCNVTHNCMEPRKLVENYPRGNRELLGPFNRFNPKDTIDWFKDANVELKTEADGRMFPITDDSQTIIDCFSKCIRLLNIQVLLKTAVTSMTKINDEQFKLTLDSESFIVADKVLLACGGGSANKGLHIAESFGHTIVKPVPSLFTFNIDDPRICDLAGISFPNATIKVSKSKLSTSGPLLITHWGLSGPAILKLSAWGARVFSDFDYNFTININFLSTDSTESISNQIKEAKNKLSQKQISKNPLFDLPKRFWEHICFYCEIPDAQIWNQVTNEQIRKLAEELTNGSYHVKGKSTFKDEFVTCGGISLKEVNFKTMESKIIPGIFFAGEILDIDGVTGGFNFQAAWTTSYIAGSSM